jgi:hypothetical protein
MLTACERRNRYLGLFQALKTERGSFESHWQDLANVLTPRRVRFFTSDKNRGDRRNQNIIDSEPLFAARTLEHGMHAGMTPPSRPWFRITTPDPDLAEQQDVKEWLHVVTERLRTVFLRSNLYTVLPMVYGDLGVFGTAAIGMVEDDEDVLRCYSFPIGSFTFGLDERGVSTMFFLERTRTVLQLVQEFDPNRGRDKDKIDWTRFSSVVREHYENGRLDVAIDVMWVVLPNDDYDPNAHESIYMQWRSCHFEVGGNRETTGMLRESGFKRFPFFVPRWRVTGEDVYGTDCPGMQALGDVRQLQFMQKKLAKAIDKAVDPPMTGPTSLQTQKVSTIAGDLTYDDNEQARGLRPVHEVRLEGIAQLAQSMAETRYRIDRAFFADMFLMLQKSDEMLGADRPTAEEIRARLDEKMTVLGPVLERLNDELFDPLMDRAFDILEDAGLVPEAPEALKGLELKVEYLSIMAQAMKLTGAAGLDRLVQSTLAIGQIPDAETQVALAKLKWGGVIDQYADMFGVDPHVVRTDEEALQIVQQRAQAAAQAEQAKAFRDQAMGAAALGKTPTQGGQSTALDDMGQALQSSGLPATPGQTAQGAPA